MIRAIIFDCDGVFIDSEPAHYEAFRVALEDDGILLSWTDYLDRYLACADAPFLQMVYRDRSRDLPDELLARLLETKRGELVTALDALPPSEATRTFASHVLAEGYRVAVASGARRVEVASVLERAGLLADIEVIVTAEDVEHGKPDPEPYLTALAELNRTGTGEPLQPGECLVIEDAAIGVAAARAAGMRVVGLTTTSDAESLAEADLVLPDLEGITLVGLLDRILKEGRAE